MPLHRRILAIAVPMILSNLSVPLVGMVDSGVAGHLSSATSLAAITVGATIFNFLFLGLNFLRMGTTGLTARAFGTRDFGAGRLALLQAACLGLALAGLLLAAQWPLREMALRLIAPDSSVATAVRRYFDLRIWSAPAVLLNYALLGWFLGMQNARAPLVMVVVNNLVNMTLDLLLVFGAGMGVDGIALASVAGSLAGTGTGALLAIRLLRRHPADWPWADLLSGQHWRRLLAINANIFLRTLCLMFAFGFFTARSARFGELVLAANGLLLNLQSVMAYALDGFAHAAEALTGRAIGQGNHKAFDATVRGALVWSLGIAVAFSMVYGLAGPTVIEWLTDLPTVRAASLTYLPWMVLSPLISVWSFLYDGVFIGATWSRAMRNSMLISTFAIFVPAWWLLRPLGNHGLWLAFLTFLGARGGTMYLFLRIRRREIFGPPRPG